MESAKPISRAARLYKKRAKEAGPRDLTLKQLNFIKAYTDPTNPKTYLNRTQSVLASYNSNSYTAAGQLGRTLMDNPRIRQTIREALDTPDIDNLIKKGVHKRLQDPESRHWQPTADYVAKIKGDFAPEKHVNVNLTPEQRDNKYDDILKLIEGKKKPVTTPNEV